MAKAFPNAVKNSLKRRIQVKQDNAKNNNWILS